MPLTDAGKKALANMRREYGTEEGKRVFYASINSGKLKGMEQRQPARANKRPRK